jgi:hypothetical protein
MINHEAISGVSNYVNRITVGFFSGMQYQTFISIYCRAFDANTDI